MNIQTTATVAGSPLGALMSGYSIEITTKDTDQVAAAATRLAVGTKISITSLPKEGVGTRLAAACEVRRVGLKPVAHISARRLQSEEDLDQYLGALRAIGAADNIFVIAGDPDVPHGPYEDALAVIESGLLERHGVRNVGIGGYPDGHTKISEEKLWAALLAKNEAILRRDMGVSIVTQFGFDAAPVLAWLGKVRAAGIEAPIRLGVPGPASAATLVRFAARCGVSASGSVVAKYGLSLTKLMQSAGPDRFLANLSAGLTGETHGNLGLHFYPFGGLLNTANWIRDYCERRKLS